jgi:outer membrane protein insertion porin family
MRPLRTAAVPGGGPILILTLLGFASGPALAQAPAQDWEGKTVSDVRAGRGWERENFKNTIGNLTPLRRGQPITAIRLDQAYKEIWKTGNFEQVRIDVTPDPDRPGQVVVTVSVAEYQTVEDVKFEGFKAIPLTQVRPRLKIEPGDRMNAFHLKQDRDAIRDEYLLKGYYFSSVREELQPAPGGGVNLTWNVEEGPLVSVRAIVFTGVTLDEGDLEKFMFTKRNGRILFIPTGKEPFVERNLREDIERIKLHYRLEGWLDIHHGDRVFVQDLEFSEDRTQVTVTIHVDEGTRYRIRNIRFLLDPASRGIFPQEEMRTWLVSKEGDPFTETNASRDAAKIREKYGERAYITAEVSYTTVFPSKGPELDLTFTIRENSKMYVGRILFEGNTKTREEVFRRELTRTGFLPGEEFNSTRLNRGMNRIRDRGYVEVPGGISYRTQEGDDPQTRDVVVEVKEGQTGNIRFAAGYSSSYGIMGIVEFTQKNFDIADVPSSFEDMINGTGFAGGGQILRLRAAPAAERQTYSADFREPYFFGYDLGMGLRAYFINTTRESYDETRLGGAVSADRRFDPFTLQVTFNAYEIEIDNIEPDAPLAVKELFGINQVYSIAPGIVFDTVDRDHLLVAHQGVHASLIYEYFGQLLPGDFDFNKITFNFETYFTLLTTESKLKHVLNPQLTVGWAYEANGMKTIPLFERFYAGGRDSIRGFEFRGMGPHENGDPVGGDAYVFASLEYTFPLFVEVLRGAVFFDVANLTNTFEDMFHDVWRRTVGFGIRFMIPQMGNIPVTLDFGFPLKEGPDDERQTVMFDIGRLF